MSLHREGLPSDLNNLLDAERSRSEPTSETQARVLSRVVATLGAGALAGASTATAHAARLASAGGRASLPGQAAGALAGAWPLWVYSVAIGVASFAIGGVTGAVTMRARLGPTPIAAPSQPSAVAAQALRQGPDRPPPAPISSQNLAVDNGGSPRSSSPSPRETGNGFAPSPQRDAQLAGERGKIELARGALTDGRVADALRILDEHAREFPNGHLVEEREALRVQALVRAHRMRDARDAAARFNARYPASLFLPAVEAAVEGSP